MVQQDMLWLVMETFKSSDALLQIAAFMLCNTLSVICSTVAGIGAAVVLIICIELSHSAVASVDSSLMAFFAAMQIQDLIISPVNAWAFRKHVYMPMVLVTAVMWMGAEVLGMEVMVHTDSVLIKEFLGWCLVLFIIWNQGLPCLRSLIGGELQKTDPSILPTAARPTHFGTVAMQSPREHLGLQESAGGAVDEESVLPCDINIDDESEYMEVIKSHDTKTKIAEPSGAKAEHQDGSLKETTADEGVDFRLNTCREWALVGVLGLGGGFLRGLCAAPLLTLAMFVMLSGIKKEQWRGTNPTLNLFTLPLRLYYYFIVKNKLEPAMAPQMVGSAIGCLLGLPLGHYLGSKVDQATFRKVVNMVVLTGAVLLVTTGFDASLTLGVVTAVGLVVFEITQYFVRKSRQPVPPTGQADPS